MKEAWKDGPLSIADLQSQLQIKGNCAKSSFPLGHVQAAAA